MFEVLIENTQCNCSINFAIYNQFPTISIESTDIFKGLALRGELGKLKSVPPDGMLLVQNYDTQFRPIAPQLF